MLVADLALLKYDSATKLKLYPIEKKIPSFILLNILTPSTESSSKTVFTSSIAFFVSS